MADEEGEKVNKGELGMSSLSTKRSRAAAIHNQSERVKFLILCLSDKKRRFV